MSDTAPQGDVPVSDAAPAASNITSEPNEGADAAADLPNEHPGVPDGTVLDTTTHDGQDVKEKVVYDFDEQTGEQVGWHKELVSE